MPESQDSNEPQESLFNIDIIHPQNLCRLARGLRPSRNIEVTAIGLTEAMEKALKGETCSVCNASYVFNTLISQSSI